LLTPRAHRSEKLQLGETDLWIGAAEPEI